MPLQLLLVPKFSLKPLEGLLTWNGTCIGSWFFLVSIIEWFLVNLSNISVRNHVLRSQNSVGVPSLQDNHELWPNNNQMMTQLVLVVSQSKPQIKSSRTYDYFNLTMFVMMQIRYQDYFVFIIVYFLMKRVKIGKRGQFPVCHVTLTKMI